MLSNYTIKRMIPRLIIAVILVNISYYVCLLLVDVSNVLGFGSYAAITSMDGGLQPDTGTDGGWEDTMSNLLIGGLAVGVTGAALALTLSIPVVIMSLLALLMVAFILIARQALIILLIVLAPLAFVAYLLPNTENLYKKWQKMFITLLMVFPVIGLVFGASKLASTILGGVDSESPDVYEVMALAVLALPLFAIPLLLKGAMAASGTIGARLSGIQDKASNAAKRSSSKNSKERWGNTAIARGYQNRSSLKNKYRDRKYNEAVSGMDDTRLGKVRRRMAKGIIGSPVLNSGKFAAERAETAAGAAFDKDFQEDVSFASAAHKGLSFSEREHMAKTGKYAALGEDGKIIRDEKGEIVSAGALTDAERASSVNYMMETGNFGERQKVIESIGTMQGNGPGQKKVREAVANGYYSSGMNKMYGSALGDQLAQGDVTGNEDEMKETLKSAAIANIKSGKMNASVFSDGLQAAYLADLVTEGRLQGDDLANVQAAAEEAIISDNIHLNDKGKDSIEKIINTTATKVPNAPSKTPSNSSIKASEPSLASDTPTLSQPQDASRSGNDSELKIEHNQDISTPSEPSMVPPQNSRTSAPPNTGNYEQRQSGLYVPPTNRETPNPPTQPPSNS